MKRFLSFLIAALVISVSFFAAGCSKKATGGVLRCLRGTFPSNMSYGPEMFPVDSISAIPYAEGLCGWDENAEQTPILAESWDVDVKNKTITWHLRKGVKFHDGTPFNAEAAKWNMQLMKDNNRMTDGQYVKSIEVIDDHTLKMNLSEIFATSVMNYGWTGMYSPTAFKNNGGKEWARLNAVGTGPFKLVEFKRDTLIRYEKNPDYWRKGYPLLEGIEARYIPDPGTAAMMMENKEADMWYADRVKYIVELEKKGMKVQWGPGMFWALMPGSADPKSPLANKKVRQAIDYAIDKPAVAKSLGFGQYEPLTQMASTLSPAYVKDYDPRPYNPEQAKKLLAEAGYSNGFDIKILAIDQNRDFVTALQSFLAKVGIRVNIDIADMGRYFGAMFFSGWSDLALAASGINADATDIFVHFGPRPMTFKPPSMAKSPEFLALCEEALQQYKTSKFRDVLKKAVKQGTEDAMLFPIYRSAEANVMQPYVHSDYLKIHGVTWYVYKDYMDKH